MILLLVALFGLLVPNGIFIYWLIYEHRSIHDLTNDHLALAFIIEAAMLFLMFTVYFARNPIGRYKWYLFVIFSLTGGLGFGLHFTGG
jgi:FtsH-binding integral membrane protein